MKKEITIITIAMLSLLVSCRNDERSGREIKNIIPSAAVSIDSAASSCPYFAIGQKGNIILSWTRNLNDSVSVLCYAVSKDNGRSFGEAKPIQGSSNVNAHSENMPKMIIKPSGEMIAVWGASNPNPGNQYSGQVYFSQSFDDGKTWNDARPLVTDVHSIDQRYFDLALLPGGEAAIVWLDNRKKTSKEGSAIYFAATSGNKGFQDEKLIGESSCECCRTDLYVDTKDNIHVAYRGILNDSIRDLMHTVSIDGGKSFSEPRRLSNDNWVIKGCPHTGPSMIENKYGLHFAWYTMGGKPGLYFCSSSDNGNSFSGKDSIRTRPSARHPQIASLPGGEMLIVWDETMQKGNVPATCIGVQNRSADGRQVSTVYVTPDTLRSAYPVVQAINENTSLIAYDQLKNNTKHVVYQVLALQ